LERRDDEVAHRQTINEIAQLKHLGHRFVPHGPTPEGTGPCGDEVRVDLASSDCHWANQCFVGSLERRMWHIEPLERPWTRTRELPHRPRLLGFKV
jgi:hypothetical protein